MNQAAIKKCFVLLLVVLLTFSACARNQVETGSTTGANDKHEQLIPMDQLDYLTLKIYFDNPSTACITYPMRQEQLMNYAERNDQVIVVESAELLQHAELLGRLNTVTLSPVEDNSSDNASLCYIFETDNGERVFELLTNHYGAATVWVNGELVANRKIFYEIIYPFLTEEAFNATGIPQSYYSSE